MKTKRDLIATVLLVLVGIAMAQDTPKRKPTALGVAEAEVLVYLSPAAKAVRKAGFDVFMEQATSPAYNQSDYYVFQMLDTRPCEMCSANVGYFAVNKHTADVRELDAAERHPLVTDGELADMQRILRDAHYITPDIINSYRNRPVWAESRH